jgi:hypothetical protein
LIFYSRVCFLFLFHKPLSSKLIYFLHEIYSTDVGQEDSYRNCRQGRWVYVFIYRVTWRVSCRRILPQQRHWTSKESPCRCVAALHQACSICTTVDLYTRKFWCNVTITGITIMCSGWNFAGLYLNLMKLTLLPFFDHGTILCWADCWCFGELSFLHLQGKVVWNNSKWAHTNTVSLSKNGNKIC